MLFIHAGPGKGDPSGPGANSTRCLHINSLVGHIAIDCGSSDCHHRGGSTAVGGKSDRSV